MTTSGKRSDPKPGTLLEEPVTVAEVVSNGKNAFYFKLAWRGDESESPEV
ncbi:hypothetical protein [Pelagicoccus sp. SDUM812003]|nr:hypothetical protein [Pelagicoccus sp. SDUM812003]MDQ8205517.1 hypothetical protein [Pelagicoccus sp. SDUM812003]